MMAKVLTEKAQVTCSHQGTGTFIASQHLLKVDEQAVLVTDDINTATIKGCTNDPPCTKLTKLTTGQAAKLKVAGKSVLLATASGDTNAGTWSVSVQPAGQTKLDAV